MASWPPRRYQNRPCPSRTRQTSPRRCRQTHPVIRSQRIPLPRTLRLPPPRRASPHPPRRKSIRPSSPLPPVFRPPQRLRARCAPPRPHRHLPYPAGKSVFPTQHHRRHLGQQWPKRAPQSTSRAPLPPCPQPPRAWLRRRHSHYNRHRQQRRATRGHLPHQRPTQPLRPHGQAKPRAAWRTMRRWTGRWQRLPHRCPQQRQSCLPCPLHPTQCRCQRPPSQVWRHPPYRWHPLMWPRKAQSRPPPHRRCLHRRRLPVPHRP